MFEKKEDKKFKKNEKKNFKGEKLAPNSDEAKAKQEKDYASHPKFAKFKGEKES